MYSPIPPDLNISLALTKTQYKLLSSVYFLVQVTGSDMKKPLEGRFCVLEDWGEDADKSSQYDGWVWIKGTGLIAKGELIRIKIVEPILQQVIDPVSPRMVARLTKLCGTEFSAEVTTSLLIKKAAVKKPSSKPKSKRSTTQ